LSYPGKGFIDEMVSGYAVHVGWREWGGRFFLDFAGKIWPR
jgi:hypothetical protein